MVDTTAYDVLLGMKFIRAVKGSYCSYTERFTYRSMDASGHLRSSTINAPCHAITRPVVAYACFARLINSEKDLQEVQCGFEDTIPGDDECGFHTSPLQMAAANLRDLVEVCDRETEVRYGKEVRSNDLLRRENAATRLSSVAPLSLPPLLPSSQWLGGAVLGAFPLNTSTVQLSQQSCTDGLHIMELFAGVGLGVLRSALAVGYTVMCYTYVDKDPVSRWIARSVLTALQLQYPKQLSDAAIRSFDKRLPQDISQCSLTFLEGLLEFNGPVDLLGGS